MWLASAGQMYNVSLAMAAVEFEAFVLIGNIIQSKTAAVFSAAVHVHPASATQLLCRRRVGVRVQDQTSLDAVFHHLAG